jgi:DNA end-binding protein Ku
LAANVVPVCELITAQRLLHFPVRASAIEESAMARPIWKGQLSFGLVNVPMTLHSGERPSDLSFHLVDSRNSARVRYERVNEETGEEVPWDKIVRAYEYKDGDYVMLTDKEMDRANVAMTHTIDITQFVDVHDIDLRYYVRPYYLVPGKGGEKGYVLLREAMAKSKKVGIATIVIRTRQHLAAVVPFEKALVLDLLRFDQELVPAREFDLPGHELAKHHVSPKELQLAQQLIEGMAEAWKPSQFHDEYRDVLRKLIQAKTKSGKTQAVFEGEEQEEVEETPSINFMEALQQSLPHAKARPTARAARSSPRTRSGRTRKARRAG